MEWTVFLTKAIMHCADRVSKEGKNPEDRRPAFSLKFSGNP